MPCGAKRLQQVRCQHFSDIGNFQSIRRPRYMHVLGLLQAFVRPGGMGFTFDDARRVIRLLTRGDVYRGLGARSRVHSEPIRGAPDGDAGKED
jgi:hypothetical protein